MIKAKKTAERILSWPSADMEVGKLDTEITHTFMH